jgi:hypothetical protein
MCGVKFIAMEYGYGFQPIPDDVVFYSSLILCGLAIVVDACNFIFFVGRKI